jgi:hypothetical protein
MVCVYFEPLRFKNPVFAGKFAGCQPFKGLESSGGVISGDEVGQMLPKLGMIIVMKAFNGGLLDGSVHAFDLSLCPWMFHLN